MFLVVLYIHSVYVCAELSSVKIYSNNGLLTLLSGLLEGLLGILFLTTTGAFTVPAAARVTAAPAGRVYR